MTKYLTGAAAALIAIATAATGASAASPDAPSGVWRNPKNTVHIKVQPCGAQVCGTVVWANERAKEKALKAGTPDLVGKQLFQEFRPAGAGTWNGRVFVPDMGRTFSGSIRAAGTKNMIAKGCLIGRFLCKSQTWTRIS